MLNSLSIKKKNEKKRDIDSRRKKIDIELSSLSSDEKKEIEQKLSKEQRRQANLKSIRERGNTLIPMYKDFRTYKPDAITKSSRKRKEAKKNARAEFNRSQRSRGDFSKHPKSKQKQLKTDSELSNLAYSGAGGDRKLPEGYRMMRRSEIPKELREHYDEKTGLLNFPSGLKALIVKGPDGIVVAFAGTEPGRKQKTGRTGTLGANVIQRLGGYSPMYQEAAGVVESLLNNLPNNQMLRATGHSLGGGLAQFATTANATKHDGRLSANCFNAAGLSASSLGALEGKIEKSQSVISHVRVEGDPVSPGSSSGESLKGSLIGEVMTLPNPKGGSTTLSSGAHGCDNVIEAIEQQRQVQP